MGANFNLGTFLGALLFLVVFALVLPRSPCFSQAANLVSSCWVGIEGL